MPLNNAVLDFHPLGVVETPRSASAGRARRCPARHDRALAHGRSPRGTHPRGHRPLRLRLIRSLYRPQVDDTGRVLYLNVDGLTNLAIAEGKICRFTRVVGSGLEGMAAELAERRSIPPGRGPQPGRLGGRQHAAAGRAAQVVTRSPSSPSPRARRRRAVVTPDGESAPDARARRDDGLGEEFTPAEPHPTATSGTCWRTASGRSPARCATHLTSTAPRTAAGMSPTSCSAVRPRRSPDSRRSSSAPSASRSAVSLSASSMSVWVRPSTATGSPSPPDWGLWRLRNESRKPDPRRPARRSPRRRRPL